MTVSAARERIRQETPKTLSARIISTTGDAALSVGLEDGTSFWAELDEKHVWEIVADGIYYLQRAETVRRLKGGNSA